MRLIATLQTLCAIAALVLLMIGLFSVKHYLWHRLGAK